MMTAILVGPDRDTVRRDRRIFDAVLRVGAHLGGRLGILTAASADHSIEEGTERKSHVSPLQTNARPAYSLPARLRRPRRCPAAPAAPGAPSPSPGPPPAPAYQPMNQPSPTATADPGMLRQAKTWFAAAAVGHRRPVAARAEGEQFAHRRRPCAGKSDDRQSRNAGELLSSSRLPRKEASPLLSIS